MHGYYSNCAFMHNFTLAEMGVFFVKICKMKGFLHFASTSTVTVVRAFNILIFFDSVGSVRERGSE